MLQENMNQFTACCPLHFLISLFIHQQALRGWCEPDPIPGTWDPAVNKGYKDACPHQTPILLGRKDLQNDEICLVVINSIDNHKAGFGGQQYLGERFLCSIG